MLKVNDENSRMRIPDPDPLVRSMDPRIRIRIHPKMSWIRNPTVRKVRPVLRIRDILVRIRVRIRIREAQKHTDPIIRIRIRSIGKKS
jgi:hypothetical protein